MCGNRRAGAWCTAAGERRVDIAYFGAHGHLPLGVALLLAAVAGALLLLIPGTVRIVHLRKTARRHHAAAQHAIASSQSAGPAQPPTGGTS
jgi:lipopolysaccharide assembly protein A